MAQSRESFMASPRLQENSACPFKYSQIKSPNHLSSKIHKQSANLFSEPQETTQDNLKGL